MLPVGARTDRPDHDYLDGVRLDLYQVADGSLFRDRRPARR